MKIRILTTGGTIDGLEYDSEDKNPTKTQTLIPKLLEQSRITAEYEIESILSKDSKFLDEKDRKLIAEKCKKSEENNIIITHGTVTLVGTAKYLAGEKISKTIILTGSIVPANQDNSDALFNLGAAFIAVQKLPKGVYIVMNGKVFQANRVMKNQRTGIFEDV
ncbi:MAG: asparaginase [Nanoarchaeota archaeon]|nr:MAG: asparaginase [Nanoarchaeota archaeon]